MAASGAEEREAAAPASERAHARGYWIALAALLGLQLALIGPVLRYPDLNLDYPFMSGDSWDWIANGLTHAGDNVRFSGRPPLLPLLLALGERAGWLELWPLLNFALAQAAVLLWHGLARALVPPRAAFAAACCLALSHLRLENSLLVMADSLAAALLLGATAAFVAAGRRPGWYLAAGLAGGLSAVTQSAALLLPLPAALAVWAGRPHERRSPWLWTGLAALMAPSAMWWTWQWLGLGPGLGNHFELLRPRLAGLGFYLFAAVAWWGAPAACAAAVGLVGWLRQTGWRAAAEGGNRWFVIALATTMAVFFAVVYDYHDQRFWLYALFPASLFLAAAFGRIRRPVALWALAALCAATAALPLPAAGQGWAAVWPLPPLYARLPLGAAVSGSAEPAAAPALVGRSWTEIHADWLPARVWAARRQPRPWPRLNSALFDGAAGAVFLFDEGNRGDRYLELTRLSNALRAPVKFLPRSWLEPGEQRLGVTAVGRHDRYQIYRARVAGLSADWLLVAAPEGAADRQLEVLARSSAGQPSATMPAGLSEALEVHAFLPVARARHVAILDTGAAWPARLYLPLVLETTEIAVMPAAGEAGLLAFLGHPRLEETRTIGGTHAERRRIRGLPGAILRPAG